MLIKFVLDRHPDNSLSCFCVQNVNKVTQCPLSQT